MKYYSFLMISTFLFYSCNDPEQKKSKLDLTLEGTHELRKMEQGNGVSAKSSGSFFLFSGNYSSEEQVGPIVSFAWKMNDSSYALSTLPFGKIRVKIVDTITIPTIKFRWEHTREVNPDNIDDVMRYEVIYAEISAKASDWPQNIVLPMNVDTIGVHN